jgi:peptide/nickel transport system permease protein
VVIDVDKSRHAPGAGRTVLASLALMAPAWLLSGLLGFMLGVVAGAHQGGWADRVIRVYAYTVASTPTFWLPIMQLIVFAVSVGWAPFCCAVPPKAIADVIYRAVDPRMRGTGA